MISPHDPMRMPTQLTKKAAAAAVCAMTLALPAAALAQSLRPLGSVTLPEIIGRVVSMILGLLGSISLLMFIYGGIVWMTAQGNDEKIKKAKNTIVYAILGLIVAFLSYTIVSYLMTTVEESRTEVIDLSEEDI
jgi:type IV secretion system pilin